MEQTGLFQLLHGFHANLLLLIGMTILLGTLGARIFQLLRIPQVVGFIVMGIAIGNSGLNILSKDFLHSMQILNFLALGVIGFNIGGELQYATFKKYGKQFIILLLSEGLSAFVLVSILTTTVGYLSTGNFKLSLALGLLLGAISSATAPAATVDVIWEYKAKGLLSTTLMALVALDDGLALLLFSISSAIASILLSGKTEGLSLWGILKEPAHEMFWSVLLGFVSGLILNRLIRALRDPEKTLDFAFGSILLVCGIAITFKLNVILSSMVLGATICNFLPRRSKEIFEIVQRFAPPIYALFFVFVGARMQLSGLPTVGWWLALAFLFGRSFGKYLGIFFGGKIAKTPDRVRKWLGLTLFSQAGVAIGLSILASQSFPPKIGNLILLVVTTTTFVVQMIGPSFVKLALVKSGEVGLNVTEEDLIADYKVKDVMSPPPPPMFQSDGILRIMELFSENSIHAYPVVDKDSHLKGIIHIDHLRLAWGNGPEDHLLIADDLMADNILKITGDTQLSEAIKVTKEMNVDVILVVCKDRPEELVGVFDARLVHQTLTQEMRRRHKASKEE